MIIFHWMCDYSCSQLFLFVGEIYGFFESLFCCHSWMFCLWKDPSWASGDFESMHCTGYVHLHDCVISPMTLTVPVPSASLCRFYDDHFNLPILLCLGTFSSSCTIPPHSQPFSLCLLQPCHSHQNNNNRWMKLWASSLFIINAFAMFLPVKGEAPTPPLSHDHLPVWSLQGLHWGHRRAFGFFFLGGMPQLSQPS